MSWQLHPQNPAASGLWAGLQVSTPDTSPRQTQCAEGWGPCCDGFITKHLVMVERDGRCELYLWICRELTVWPWATHSTTSNCFLIYKRKDCSFTHSFFFSRTPKQLLSTYYIPCTIISDKLWGYKMSKAGFLTTGSWVDCINAPILYPTLYLIYPTCIDFVAHPIGVYLIWLWDRPCDLLGIIGYGISVLIWP